MKVISLFLMFLCAISCKTAQVEYCGKNNSYAVRKIKRKSNNVYILFLERNDSTFVVASHYDKNKKNGTIKIKKNSLVNISLHSIFPDSLLGMKLMRQDNIADNFYGHWISRDMYHTDDVYYSNDLNGLYLCDDENKEQ